MCKNKKHRKRVNDVAKPDAMAIATFVVHSSVLFMSTMGDDAPNLIKRVRGVVNHLPQATAPGTLLLGRHTSTTGVGPDDKME